MKTPSQAPRDSVHRARSSEADGKNQQMGDFVNNRPAAAAQVQLGSAIDASPRHPSCDELLGRISDLPARLPGTESDNMTNSGQLQRVIDRANFEKAQLNTAPRRQ